MSALGEQTLIQHLVDRDSVETLAREGLALETVPTEDFRPIVQFALDYYFSSGRTKAPSEAVLRTEFGDVLEDNEVEFKEPDESVEWAIDDLKGTFIHREASAFNKRMATAISESGTSERLEVLSESASDLVRLSMVLQPHYIGVDAREGLEERLVAYEARAADRDASYGLKLGLPEIDAYTGGIHPGELAIVAAGPKVGKSFFLDRVALKEWQEGRAVVLYSLENSVDMTLDRIACLATGTSYREWQHGTCHPERVAVVRQMVEEMKRDNDLLYVTQPPATKSTVEHMVREAQVREAQTLIIDQLNHIEYTGDARQPRYLQVGEITRSLRSLIRAGREQMPCLLAHQINREGVKAARKLGYLEMEHLAESAEVERTSDWVFGIYRSRDERASNQAKFQTLAARREDVKHFQMRWNIDGGMIQVMKEIQLEQ